MHVSFTSLTIKVTVVAKMMQRAYLCVILYVKHQKVTASAVLT